MKAAYLTRRQLLDPLGVVEAIYADFDYPEVMETFVRYMPLLPGQEGSEDGVFDRWRQFLEEEGRRLTSN